VSQRVIDDRERASTDLDQSSGDLKETIQKARRVHRIADRLDEARSRNHFSESMELLFTTGNPHYSHRPHHPKDVP
jgi:hypothetical protein